ncbi:MAG: hypothetical protein N2202_03325 [Proteobacteria bacterium]|nr:hypothetical protein [Pseudomonadota bacterium]
MQKKIYLILLFNTLFFSCSANGIVNPEKFYEKDYSLVWPAPPNKPRIELVKVITSPFDTSKVVEETKVSKIVKWLLGEEVQEINSFFRPYSVYKNGGKIFVVEQGLFSVVVMDIEKGKTSFLQLTPAGDILYYPTSVTADDEGNIYVCDPEKERIVVYNPNGKPNKIYGLEYSPWRPCGIAFNKKNKRFYVVDSINHRVKIFDKNFILLKTIGRLGEENGEFNYPTHIFVDRDGNFYVTDSMNFRVQFFSEDGKFLGKIGKMGKGDGYLERPKGVCVDTFGHIYVVDSLQGSIQIYDKNDRFLMAFGVDGNLPGQFNLASGIFCDERNYIYVADTLNKRVQILRYIGSLN